MAFTSVGKKTPLLFSSKAKSWRFRLRGLNRSASQDGNYPAGEFIAPFHLTSYLYTPAYPVQRHAPDISPLPRNDLHRLLRKRSYSATLSASLKESLFGAATTLVVAHNIVWHTTTLRLVSIFSALVIPQLLSIFLLLNVAIYAHSGEFLNRRSFYRSGLIANPFFG
jgi:hypothetical protein